MPQGPFIKLITYLNYIDTMTSHLHHLNVTLIKEKGGNYLKICDLYQITSSIT